MGRRDVVLNMKAPAGKPLKPDKDLKKRVQELPPDSSLSDYFRILEGWKGKAIAECKQAERKAPTVLVGL